MALAEDILTGEIQMCINVACCADVTVTQPLLDPSGSRHWHRADWHNYGADRESGYASSGVRPENPGNVDSESRAESAFPSGLHKKHSLEHGYSIKLQTAEGFTLLLKPPYGTIVSFHLSFFQNFD